MRSNSAGKGQNRRKRMGELVRESLSEHVIFDQISEANEKVI